MIEIASMLRHYVGRKIMIEEFLRYIRNDLHLAELTVEAYRNDLCQWEAFATDGGRYELRPETTTISDLRLWVASKSREGVSARTLRRKIQALRAFFNWMMRYRGLTSNPAAALTLPQTARNLPVNIRPEETEKIIDGADIVSEEMDFEEQRNSLIVELLYATGIRCSELVGLTDAAVDTIRGELKVLGKRNKERIVPFGAELSAKIESYRRARELKVGMASASFFVRADGRPVYRKLVYNVVHQALDGRVHAERKSPHVLRHSFATDMLNAGADLTSVQQLLGHSSLAATEIYTHISYREIKQNYQLAHPRAQKKGG